VLARTYQFDGGNLGKIGLCCEFKQNSSIWYIRGTENNDWKSWRNQRI